MTLIQCECGRQVQLSGNKNLCHRCGTCYSETGTRLQKAFEIGDGVTLCGYSDREAYTVISMTPRTIKVQRDKATLLNGMNSGQPDALQASVGGFCAHVSGEQRYAYESDPTSEDIEVVRLTKKGWIASRSGRAVIHGRHEKYDYNF